MSRSILPGGAVAVIISDPEESTDFTTGAVTLDGGVNVAKNLRFTSQSKVMCANRYADPLGASATLPLMTRPADYHNITTGPVTFSCHQLAGGFINRDTSTVGGVDVLPTNAAWGTYFSGVTGDLNVTWDCHLCLEDTSLPPSYVPLVGNYYIQVTDAAQKIWQPGQATNNASQIFNPFSLASPYNATAWHTVIRINVIRQSGTTTARYIAFLLKQFNAVG